MADSSSDTNREEPGVPALKKHIVENKVDFALWITRVLTVLFTVGYFIPIFWNPYTLYYKALLSNSATSALRLHQRLPRVTLTREFLQQLLLEDSCHYLLYSAIFFHIPPVTLVLLPVFLFGVLHSASYSLTLLDKLGQNAWWGARLLISVIEFQSRNILRLVSFTEIFLMPFTVILIFLGRANLLTPFLYYQFLCLRYSSRRNPYTRNMFHELHVMILNTANKPGMPGFIKNFLLGAVTLAGRFAPTAPVQEQRTN